MRGRGEKGEVKRSNKRMMTERESEMKRIGWGEKIRKDMQSQRGKKR